ncbi:MAG: ATP-binding protein [bacterium]|nr:ATP-binding protein [bacterium]
MTADGGAGAAVPCDCTKRDRPHEYRSKARIPARYQHCRLGNFKSANVDPHVHNLLQRALSTSKRYVDNFFDPIENRTIETGLIYIGNPGTGKTHLAVAVLAELIDRYRVRGRFVDFTALIQQIQSTFDPSSAESKHQILDPIMSAEVLVLDELGAQKPTEFVMDTLYLIMNTRYLRRLPTIFTTNYRLDLPGESQKLAAIKAKHMSRLNSDAHAAQEIGRRESGEAQAFEQKRPVNPYGNLRKKISAQLVSRLYEMALPIRFPDWDFRREVKVGQHDIWHRRSAD